MHVLGKIVSQLTNPCYKIYSPVSILFYSIEGEYVPREGDEVKYRLCPIPPKFEKDQAVHVEIINFTPGVHQRWNAPQHHDNNHE